MQLLHNCGIRFGLFCSQAVAIYSCRIEVNQSSDIDLMVHPDDFRAVINICKKYNYLYDLSCNVRLENICRGGGSTNHIMDKLIITAGNDSIDICYPKFPILFKSNNTLHLYNWSLTNTAFAMCKRIITKNGLITLAPAYDCLALYVILQRLHKDDYLKAVALARSLDLNSQYVKTRSRELNMHRDERAQKYLKHIQTTLVSIANKEC